MKKGLVLTLDALLAVIVMGVFLLTISMEIPLPSEAPYLFKTSADFLSVLDMQSVAKNLSKQTDAQAKNTLNYYLSTLPPNVEGNITVKIYERDGGFSLIRTISVAKGTRQGDIVAARRVFAITDGEENFGLMKMEMWYV